MPVKEPACTEDIQGCCTEDIQGCFMTKLKKEAFRVKFYFVSC